MPNIRSAAKRMRSDGAKRVRNQAVASELKTMDRKLHQMTDGAEAREFARRVMSRYDRAVSRGIIPRGRADRKKSRLSAFLAKLKQ